jgi:hypothetical protein
MGMKWVGRLNHNLQHDTSQSPRESPTATFHSETQQISGWVLKLGVKAGKGLECGSGLAISLGFVMS